MIIAATLICYYLIPSPTLALYLGIAYLLADLGLLFGILTIHFISKRNYSELSLPIMAMGFLFCLMADGSYLFLIIKNDYFLGFFIDFLRAISILLIGISGIYAKNIQDTCECQMKLSFHCLDSRNALRLFVPYISIIAFYFFILFQEVKMNSLMLGLSLAVILVITRQIIILFDKNEQLAVILEKIEHMAYHDLLTGLPNRRLFEERLNSALTEAKYMRKMVGVMFLDLDRFKSINDNWGHAFGDLLLKEVARRLLACVEKEDTVSRQGGDEFTILVKNICHLQDISKIAERIGEKISLPFYIQDKTIYTSCSIGIAVYPYDGTDWENLMKSADIAMYKAKELGKNNYQFHTPNTHSVISRKLLLEHDMHQALANGEFLVYYQPRVNVALGKIVGVEALLRWNHPKMGMIPPGEFVPIAEESGIIVKLGEWILRTACQEVNSWQKCPQLTLGVNLSLGQFQQENLVESIRNILQETSFSAHCLNLEITESIAMYHPEFVVGKLKAIKNLGIQISLDDFGTGYSSLSYLRKFPLHTLKIAQVFIRDLTTSQDDASIVRAIISLAHNLNLNVVAEGVETKEQMDFLIGLGCNEMQGFLFSQPIPKDVFLGLLE